MDRVLLGLSMSAAVIMTTVVSATLVAAAAAQSFAGGSRIERANQMISARQSIGNPNGIDTTNAIVAEQGKQGPAVCGWIGVRVSPMTPAFADSLGMAEPYGAILDRPEPGSPAANAGIEVGDVIAAIDGSQLVRLSDFAAIISAMAPGTTVHLSTWRNGELIEVKLILGSSGCARGRHGRGGAAGEQS